MKERTEGYLCNIFARATVYPDGQKVDAVVLEYSFPIETESLRKEMFEVDNRTITDVYATTDVEAGKQDFGSYVVIALSQKDEASKTLESRGRGFDARTFFKEMDIRVAQKKDLVGMDGSVCLAGEEKHLVYKISSPLVERFSSHEYKGISYNLFIPEHYDADKKYPLVVFIEDAGVLGKDARIALAQGIGGVIWATEKEQKKHECFVLAPQFPGPSLTNDEYEAAPEIETVKEMIDYISDQYSVDKNRIYGTGQSMGCMVTYELNVRYPDLYAACLLVGGQWNPDTVVKCKEKNFWIVVSEGDEKAFPINNQITENLEKAGAKVGRYRWDAKKPEKELNTEIARALEEDCNIRYSVLTGNSVLPDGVQPHPLQFHINTWRVAYTIEGLRDWLFCNRKY
jgi:predicted peptidase